MAINDNEENRERKRQKKGFFRRLSKKERVIFVFPAVAAVIAICVTTFINMSVERYTLPYEGIRYYAGSSFAIEADSVLKRADNNTTVVELQNSEYELDSLPIYYKDINTILLANNMVYVEPRMNEVSRLDYFSEIEFTSNGSIYATKGNDEVFLRGGFAYDGEDIYVFFEDVIIEYNGYKMVLPAMSYVEAVFTGDVMIYNSGAGEQYMEAPKGDVIVTLSDSETKLSLIEDSMSAGDGTKQLIFTRPDVLDSIY